jgi:hypothetical protein
MLVVVAACCAIGTAVPVAAGYRVSHARVSGIGLVRTTLPKHTRVRWPGYIPTPAEFDRGEFERQDRREGRLNRRLHPSSDRGPSRVVRRVKADAANDLFLELAAVACEPIPKASLWVYSYVNAAPGLRPELANLQLNIEASRDAPSPCEPVRLRIDRWLGVRVDRTRRRAHAMLRGAYEFKHRGRWRPNGRSWTWKLALRHISGRWRLAVQYELIPGEFPD